MKRRRAKGVCGGDKKKRFRFTICSSYSAKKREGGKKEGTFIFRSGQGSSKESRDGFPETESGSALNSTEGGKRKRKKRNCPSFG